MDLSRLMKYHQSKKRQRALKFTIDKEEETLTRQVIIINLRKKDSTI